MLFETVVDAPRDEVFAWYGRPGALVRLLPPWQPVSVVRQADSLEDGRAVLGLPLGIKWVAKHQADGFDPPNVFVDDSNLLPWRHTHEFVAETDHTTRVIDRVDTPVPRLLLRGMFRYRYRQLADDLAVHAKFSAKPLTVAVTGSSGLIGTALTAFLSTGGHRVIQLVRREPWGPDERQWQPKDPAPDLLKDVDAVVHLAGASIAGRFTPEHKKLLRDSRIEPTRRLAELAAKSNVQTFVSASAIGFYGPDRGDATLTEDSVKGEGFLADLVADWEDVKADLRVVHVRTGIVQSPRGGVLRLLYPLFFAGLGGRLGDGAQWMSWIGIDDLCDIYLRALVDPNLAGPVNAVAPEPVRNVDYTRILASVLRRPALLPVPRFGPRLLLGEEGATELALASQRVEPRRLLELGHEFRDPRLAGALRHVLGR